MCTPGGTRPRSAKIPVVRGPKWLQFSHRVLAGIATLVTWSFGFLPSLVNQHVLFILHPVLDQTIACPPVLRVVIWIGVSLRTFLQRVAIGLDENVVDGWIGTGAQRVTRERSHRPSLPGAGHPEMVALDVHTGPLRTTDLLKCLILIHQGEPVLPIGKILVQRQVPLPFIAEASHGAGGGTSLGLRRQQQYDNTRNNWKQYQPFDNCESSSGSSGQHTCDPCHLEASTSVIDTQICFDRNIRSAVYSTSASNRHTRSSFI